MPDLELILLGNLVAVVVGCSKTGVPGMGILAVALMANLMPGETKLSVGTLLPMLIAADLFAVAYYRHHAQWNHIRKLLPWVLLGLVLGAFALDLTGRWFSLLLGGLVLVMLLVDLLRRGERLAHVPRHPLFAASMGTATGFATTVGNVAGPIMTVYLQAQGMDKNRFMGSMAWFFLIINCTKVPLFIGKGMINRESLLFDACMIPGVVAGALVGRRLFLLIPEKVFAGLVLALAALSALRLLWGS